MKTVSLVGSTGSIGTQAIDVVETDPDRFRVVALAAHRSVDLLVEQARRLRPELVAVGDPALVPEVAAQLPRSVEVMGGPEGLEAAGTAADVIVNGVVGFAGLPVTLAALEAGRRLALANKESLIAGAPVVQRARQTPGAHIVPVDSEHCAIHQCLVATSADQSRSDGGGAGPGRAGPDGAEPNGDGVRRLLVTASGGPFRGRSRDELGLVGVDDALAHPTWRMGRKITIDSSTLMNKGLEVIEAHELFGVDYDRIDVVVHPQSIVHSMVELFDGTTIAQLSQPDMRLPIGYAMGWPERLATPFGAIDWSGAFSLSFEPPDRTGVRLPRPRLPGRSSGRRGAGVAERRQRGGRGGLPRGPARLARHRRGRRGRARRLHRRTDGGGRRRPRRRPPGPRAGRRRRRAPAGRGMTTTTGHPPVVVDRPAAGPNHDGGVPPTEPGPPPTPGSPAGGDAAAGSRGWALVRLVVAMAAVVAVFLAAGLSALLVVIVAIIVMVMVHELGHFATAKWSRMKVTEYFVGFGPRLWSIRRGETEYGVKAIPAGGYVKIPGMSNLEEIDPADEAGTYRQQPFHKRIIVASAGSFMHFVMALLLAYAALLFFGNPTSAEHVTIAELLAVGRPRTDGRPGGGIARGRRGDRGERPPTEERRPVQQRRRPVGRTTGAV